jgi:hypothetical protein
MFSWSFLGGAFLTSARVRPITSLARLPSLMIRPRGPPHLLQIGRLGAKRARRSIGVGERRGDRLADFMGNRGRQLPGGSHAIGAGELHLRVAQTGLPPTLFFLGALQVLDVGARSIPFDDGSPPVAQWGETQQKPAIFSVGPPQTYLLLERLSSRERSEPVVHGAVLGM